MDCYAKRVPARIGLKYIHGITLLPVVSTIVTLTDTVLKGRCLCELHALRGTFWVVLWRVLAGTTASWKLGRYHEEVQCCWGEFCLCVLCMDEINFTCNLVAFSLLLGRPFHGVWDEKWEESLREADAPESVQLNMSPPITSFGENEQ